MLSDDDGRMEAQHRLVSQVFDDRWPGQNGQGIVFPQTGRYPLNAARF